MYFQYDETQTDYLKAKDKKIAAEIERIGHINREVDDDLFASVVHHILGQQISTAAQATVWKRFTDALGTVDAEGILSLGRENLKSIGTTYKKTEYILDFVTKVSEGSFDIDALKSMPDEQVIRDLSSLKGIGVWTAEMIMIFCMQRPDVVSYGDLKRHAHAVQAPGHRQAEVRPSSQAIFSLRVCGKSLSVTAESHVQTSQRRLGVDECLLVFDVMVNSLKAVVPDSRDKIAVRPKKVPVFAPVKFPQLIRVSRPCHAGRTGL